MPPVPGADWLDIGFVIGEVGFNPPEFVSPPGFVKVEPAVPGTPFALPTPRPPRSVGSWVGS